MSLLYIMNRYVSLIIILVLGVLALALLYVLTEKSRKEQFNDNENENQPVNPHRLILAPNSDSCENLLDKKGFVSVQEFIDGARYRCY